MRLTLLGEVLYEGQAKVTGLRVLEGGKMEVTFQESGKMLGTDYTGIVTVISAPRPDGTLFGQGQGLLTTKEGEAVTWVGQGLGWFSRPGAVSWRGVKVHQTSSQKLARLNKAAVVFEADGDEQGNFTHKHWEWK